MSKKRASRNNKKVLKALKKKRSSYNIGGYGIRRNRFGEFEPPVPKKIPAATTTPAATATPAATTTPASGFVGPEQDFVGGVANTATTTTGGTNTNGGGTTTTTGTADTTTESTETQSAVPRPEQSDYKKRGRYGSTVDNVEAYEAALAAWEAVYGKGSGTGTGTRTGGNNPVADPTEQQKRIEETASRAEKLAAGDIEGSGVTLPKADVVKTGVDAEGQPLSNLTTSDEDIEEISTRSTTTAPDDITAQDISTTTAGVTKATAPSDISATQVTAEKVGDLSATTAAQGAVTKSAEATDATLTEKASAAQSTDEEVLLLWLEKQIDH